MSSKQHLSPLRRMLRVIGPGFITGASDDDPSGILTYAQTGAQFGVRQLWTVVLALPFMITIQEMCGRIGMVTGKGLAGVIRTHYSRGLLLAAIALLFFANVVNIGADLGAMAASAQMIVGLPFWTALGGMTVATLCLEIFIPYPTYARYLKYLTLTLLAYIVAAFMIEQDWESALSSAVIPSVAWDREVMMNIVAVFGTTISPYLFFWQADEEVEEEVARGELREMGVGIPHITAGEIGSMRIDTAIGMLFSNLVAFFIILTCASTLAKSGITRIETAAQGAEALRPIAGDLAALLFSAGIIGTGLLAVPILAGSASYAISESFGWKEGLSKAWWQAKGFYGVIAIAMILGLLINIIDIPPFRMLYYTAVLNGLSAPLLLVLILLIANNKKIMGKHRNSLLMNVLAIIITVFMGGAGIALLFA